MKGEGLRTLRTWLLWVELLCFLFKIVTESDAKYCERLAIEVSREVRQLFELVSLGETIEAYRLVA